jgi:hypothetical protein
MATVLTILAIAISVAIAGLAVEIGIASWTTYKAHMCQREKADMERTAEWAISQQMKSLDEYAWLLNFLYKRYDKFTDLEKEINDGLKDVTGDIFIGEADDRYKDLKKALKIIQVTVKASERMDKPMKSIDPHVEKVMEDSREDEESESEESSKLESAE